MIDPIRITDFDRSDAELEELLLFCIAAAGKNATTMSIRLEELLLFGRSVSSCTTPFSVIDMLAKRYNLANLMKGYGFGCYTLKSRGFIRAARSGINLRTCAPEDLEAIPGIGPKTSRFFILHSRRDANVACLDVHVLRWMRHFTGYEVPKQTPSGHKYRELESVFLNICTAMNTDPATLDLKIWNRERGSDEESLAKVSKAKKQ